MINDEKSTFCQIILYCSFCISKQITKLLSLIIDVKMIHYFVARATR